MDHRRAAQAAERGRGNLSRNAAQAARRPHTTGALGELEINVEGRHRPAVTEDHRNRRVTRGAGRPSPCPTFVVGRAPTFTKPGHTLARPGHCLVQKRSDVEAELHGVSSINNYSMRKVQRNTARNRQHMGVHRNTYRFCGKPIGCVAKNRCARKT